MPQPASAYGSSRQSQPWKSWNIPVQSSQMRRKLCGLLNKLARSTFESVSEQVVALAINVEKSDDPEVLQTFVRDIFHRGVDDPARCEIYAGLCQRILDGLEGERYLWRKVDLYHVGNPAQSFETELLLISTSEIAASISTKNATSLRAQLAYLGELVVQGVLFVEDMQDTLDALFQQAERANEDHALALSRFLTRITRAFNALQILQSMQAASRIERVLKVDGISARIRYLFMSILDQVLYPRPLDAFSSDQERTEVYGLDLDESDTESYLEEEEEESGMDPTHLQRVCQERACAFLHSRNHSHIASFLSGLRHEHRGTFVQAFAAAALHSGDDANASFVGTAFSRSPTINLCYEGEALERGFGTELSLLEDTILDVPNACRLMAIILHSTTLHIRFLESIVQNSVPKKATAVRDRVLEELRALDPEDDDDRAGNEETRQNRFERGSTGSSSPKAVGCC